jgi:hypothetical protein
MASNLMLAPTTVDMLADAISAALSNGFIRIYGGEQSAPGKKVTDKALATLRFGSPAFSKASGGEISTTRVARKPADETGKATWFRCFKSDGETAILDGSVGVSGCDLNLDNTSLQAGGEVWITSFSLSLGQE